MYVYIYGNIWYVYIYMVCIWYVYGMDMVFQRRALYVFIYMYDVIDRC